MTKTEKPPIINVHAHTFTDADVAPLLARKFLPFPFYYLVHLNVILTIYRFFNKVNGKSYTSWYRKSKRIYYNVTVSIDRIIILKILRWIAVAWLIIAALLFTFDFLAYVIALAYDDTNFIVKKIDLLDRLFEEYGLIPENFNIIYKVIISLFVLIFIKVGRNLILFIFKNIFVFLKRLPGKESWGLIERYLYIAKFSVYKSQTDVFAKMKDQYPKGSGFGILPMDMHYMGAGSPRASYVDQLAEVAKYKNSKAYAKQKVGIYPFIFVDPRRIREDQSGKTNRKASEQLFNYHIDNQKVILDDCLVKTYIEGEKFSGFKIYPALGYYPFDKELLPIWKYAADHNLPITTHCIRGTIFYRGTKKKQWDTHPVFMDENTTKSLLLPERGNADFQLNFTHPMNFLCLLEEPLLRKLLTSYNDDEINTLFGYTNPNTPLTSDLSQLKINLAHFGGEDQWLKYLNNDRYSYSQMINTKPGKGIEFVKYSKDTGEVRYRRLAEMWKYVDWYSIICSMMMRYDNVYADISYIIHNEVIFPLLKETLKPIHGQLCDRVLFGTDFYVVRNHDSEKGIFVESQGFLSDEEFDCIARTNPRTFLNLPDFVPEKD